MSELTSADQAQDPALASSLIITADSGVGIEIFMVARNYEVDSFSGALVFPGGKLHTEDSKPEARKYCPDSATVDDEQLALRLAAIREAFEESGLLLARSRVDGELIDKARMEALGCYRAPLESGDIGLPDIAEKEGLELAVDLLVHFSNLVTPLGWTKKRFDTHFFVVAIPGDYKLLHDGSETVSSLWKAPTALLREADEGRWTIVFPTRANLSKVATFAGTESLTKNCETTAVEKITPEYVQEGDTATLSIPPEAGFPFCRQQLQRPAR